jgi:hypothetical protein
MREGKKERDRNTYHNLLSDGVVTTSVVVSGILLASNELLRMEQLSVGTSPHFINDSGLEIKEHGTGNVLASTSLGEEGVEGIVSVTNGLVGGHLSIGLNSVLKTVELPAGITHLGTSLSDMDWDNCMNDC